MFEFLKGPTPPGAREPNGDTGIHGPTPVLERLKALVGFGGKQPPAS